MFTVTGARKLGLHRSCRVFLVAVTVACVCVDRIHGQTDSMSPTTVSDVAGNKADSNSSITWAPIPTGKPLKTSATTDEGEGALKALMDMTRTFVKMIAPGDLPYDLLSQVIGGNINAIVDGYSALIPVAAGIGVCFVLGFLFIFIMPIVGCCLCCCRTCCGNCGGKKLQRKHPKDGCKRIAFSICLLCVVILMMCGTICTYVTNDKFSDAIDDTVTTITNNLDDLPTFLDNTIEQINFVAQDNFNFTLAVIDRDLDNIGYIVGVPVRDDLAVNGGVDAAINSIIAMEAVIIPVGDALFALNKSIDATKTSATKLKSDLSTLKTNIDAAKGASGCTGCGSIDTSNLVMDVNFDNLPDISSSVNSMETVRSQNLTALALEGKAEFNTIPERVRNETLSTVSTIRSSLAGIKTTINNTLSSLTSLPSSVTTQINGFKPTILEMLSYAVDYNPYRWYGFMGLTGLIGIIVLFQLLGLACGVFGTHKDALPTERGCLSTTGGNCLMAAAGFMFIFSSLLMLLTSLTFVIGAPMEKLMCQPLKDPDLKIMKELLDKPDGPLGKGYFLGGMLFSNSSIPLTISGILTGCKNGETAYKAMMLGNFFDLNSVIDYKSQIDFDQQLDSINVDLSTVKILSTDTENQLNEFKSSAQNMNFTAFKSELNKNTSKADLDSLATALDAAAGNSADPAKGLLTAEANRTRTIKSKSYKDVNDAKIKMASDVNNLKTTMSPVPANVDKTKTDAKAVDDYMANNGSQLIKTEAKNYANRMLNTADQFAKKALDAIQNDVAKCTPIWNIWFSIIHKILCSNFIGSLNAFWFSLGWCVFFFVPGIIFSIKLARYFRRMKYLEGYDDPSDVPLNEIKQGPPSGKSPVFANNKVKPI